jgi:hypothetical protein
VRSFIPLITACLLLVPSITRGETADLGGFEMWEDHLGESAETHTGSSSPVPAGRVIESKDVTESQRAESEDEEGYIIWFGGGASLMMPLRLSGGSNDSKVLSEFSVSWAPFGIPGEIGVDLLMNRNNTFLVRPNLKFFFVKHKMFSLYFEGSCAILSTAGGTHFGGGGGIGLGFGLMDHLALELRATAVAMYVPDEAMTAFADMAPAEGGEDLMVVPSIGARLTARF